MSFTAVVDHRKSIIITFNKQCNERCDPSEQRNERQQQEANEINGLPKTISQRQLGSSPAIFNDLFKVERKIFPFDDGFGLFTEIREHRRTNDEPDIFKKRKIKQ